MMREPISKEAVAREAYRVGRLAALGGDSYDLVEELARGYADELALISESDGASPSVEALAKRLHIGRQISLLDALSRAAQEVIFSRVEDGRHALMTWQEIGDKLDITKQAAQQRYS